MIYSTVDGLSLRVHPRQRIISIESQISKTSHLVLRQLETHFFLLDVDDAHLDRHDRPLVEAAVGKIEELLSMRPAPIRIMLLVADDMTQSENVLCESS